MNRCVPADQARRQGEREFGNVPPLQDEAADAWGTVWLDALTTDTRFPLRQFGRGSVTTLVMFVVLAVGMSLSTLLFSYAHCTRCSRRERRLNRAGPWELLCGAWTAD